MTYESPEVIRTREERRAGLAARTGELIERLTGKPPAERLHWYRDNRGEFFFGPHERAARVASINGLVPSRKTAVAATAERLLAHEFDILGSGPVSLGACIDWQRDFKSGIRWREDVIYPAWNWRQVDDLSGAEIYRGHFYSIDDPSDLKVPWDLSSFFHMPVLAEAFLQTGDQRYKAEVVDQLRDWHERNPYPRGVNWTCAMVGGIRLANLAFTLRLIEPDDFLGDVAVLSILRHIKFILDFLEVDEDGRRNNHYLNNLVGLGFGAAEVARSEFGCDLLDFVSTELNRELVTQFSPDGTNYEGTIPYQRFATETAILTAILLERNGRELLPEPRARLERSVRFIDSYTKPNGLAPQYGDNDNGRILVLHDYDGQEYRDHRHIVAVGAAWLQLEDLTADLSAEAADTVWLLGSKPPATTLLHGTAFLSGLYNNNGYALAKMAQSSFLIRCGRINPMSGGGHNHCDQLSFEFHDRGQDLVIDPGALIYSADSALRNQFRSTAAHNVLQLDGLEQQDFNLRDLFAMQDRAAAAFDSWEVADGRVLFRGRHFAYRAAGWDVGREIRCDLEHGKLSVCDFVERVAGVQDAGQFCGRLHLAAGIGVEQTEPGIFLLHAGSLRWTISFDSSLQLRRCDGQVSPSYGVSVPAVILEYRFSSAESMPVRFSIERTNS